MSMRRHQEAPIWRALLDPPPAPPHRRYTPVPLERIAPALPRAAIVAEDNNFLEHGGIDFQAVRYALGYRRATFRWSSPGDVWALAGAVVRSGTGGRRLRGGSTITQQLAKNLYLSPSRNPLRKLKEAVTAYRLEAALGKRRILELYLNVVELGDEVWGVEAASRRYFGRSAAELSTAEAAALAATLPSPLSSNPAFRPARMQRRQQLILPRLRRRRVPLPEPSAGLTDPAVEPTGPRSF
jgi:monofunctional biosynthetic peptidoglycan transglycosylase